MNKIHINTYTFIQYGQPVKEEETGLEFIRYKKIKDLEIRSKTIERKNSCQGKNEGLKQE